MGIGPNKESYFTNSIPDCNKTYYYALRAFDMYGNGSGIVADSITTVTTSTTTSTTTASTNNAAANSTAIAISNNTVPQEENETENVEIVGEKANKTEDVLGVSTHRSNISQNDRNLIFIQKNKFNIALILLFVLTLGIYVYFKKRKV
jgi:hypothetical protein